MAARDKEFRGDNFKLLPNRGSECPGGVSRSEAQGETVGEMVSPIAHDSRRFSVLQGGRGSCAERVGDAMRPSYLRIVSGAGSTLLSSHAKRYVGRSPARWKDRRVEGTSRRSRRILSELRRCGDTISLDRVLLSDEVITLDRVVSDQVVGGKESLHPRPQVANEARVQLVEQHLHEVGRLIAGQGEDGKLISWVLEDCAELLRRELRESE